jgi:hypothetical protein
MLGTCLYFFDGVEWLGAERDLESFGFMEEALAAVLARYALVDVRVIA